MASREVHLAQACHNEALANLLTQTMEYRDWVITAAFYAAVHYAEAFFFSVQGIEHSETSVDRDEQGKLLDSIHRWRRRLLQVHSTGVAYVCYRNLQEASEIARYLGADKVVVTGTACDFFPVDAVMVLLGVDLSNLKKELGFPPDRATD